MLDVRFIAAGRLTPFLLPMFFSQFADFLLWFINFVYLESFLTTFLLTI